MRNIRLFTLILGVALFGCQGQTEPEDNGGEQNGNGSVELVGNISLSTEREVIKADGEYSTKLTVMLRDKRGIEHDVTSEVEIYCEGIDQPLESSDFKTSVEGDYVFYAIRGFYISNEVSVKAVKGVPDLPADEAAANMSFLHRIMLLQHTGDTCPNCPKLMNILKRLADDDEYNSFYHHVASHSYNDYDPAGSAAARSLSKDMNPTRNYPMLTYNLKPDEDYPDEATIKKNIMDLHKDVADAGISASAALVGNNVYANISVKSAVTAKYRVAVWILEDNVHATQSGADASWQNIHENCLRLMNGNTKNECIYGKHIGVIEAGETSEIIAAMELEDGWIAENCKLIILAVSGDGDYDLVNCTVCHLDSSVSYEYL